MHGRNERERRELRPGFVHGHLGEELRRAGKSAGPSAGTFPRARGRGELCRRETIAIVARRPNPRARVPPGSHLVEQGGGVRDASGDGVGRGRTGETITQTFEEGPIGIAERDDDFGKRHPSRAGAAQQLGDEIGHRHEATRPPTGADMM